MEPPWNSSEGAPEPPLRTPPGQLRMLENDEVLSFFGAQQFWHHKVTVGRFHLSSFRALRLSALSLYS